MTSIYYISEIDFTQRNASTKRILDISKILTQNTDYQVKIIGNSHTSHLVCDGFQVFNTPKGHHIFTKIINYIRRGLLMVNLLKRLPSCDIIIYYGTNYSRILPLKRFCHKHRIKLIIDIVEWYNYNTLPFGKYGPLALDVHLGINKIIPKCDGVIAISSYLQEFYKQQNVKTIRIPVLSSGYFPAISTDNDWNEDYLHLIYAGVPYKKDSILPILKAVDQLALEEEKIRFHLLGPTPEYLYKLYHYLPGTNIICHGHIPQNKVAEFLQKADFSVLIRPHLRYAEAGFPTKFVESLSAGLPVIANITSDLNLYLKDGFNGFIVDSPTQEALISKLRYILSVPRKKFQNMKQNAKETAQNYFAPELYIKSLNEFITSI